MKTGRIAGLAVLPLVLLAAGAWGEQILRTASQDPQAAPHAEKPSKVLPLPGEVFMVERCTAFLISPAETKAAAARPWVWYAPTLPGLPGPEERWMFQKFLDAGIAIAGIDVGESYGSPRGRALYSAFHEELTRKRGLSGKACLLARSRGGLMLYNWAVEHPASVACIAGIYPVCNIESYPGIKNACGAYGMTEEQLRSELASHNPLDRVEPLAKARVPIFHIHGDADTVVPLDKNSGELARRYRNFGGRMTLAVEQKRGHDMWPGWFQCQELVTFVIAHAGSAGPLAPDGASAKFDQVVYRGWPALQWSNGTMRLQVVPEIGGRVIQFVLGGKEFLWVNPQLAGKSPPASGLAADGGWLNYGGDKLWPAPQGWDNDAQWPGPPDAVLDGQPYRAEVLTGGRAVKLTSRDDPRSGIRFSRTVRPLADRSGVQFEATMTNVDSKPRRWGIWAHTQLDAARNDGACNRQTRAYCPLNPQSRFPRGYRVIFGEEDNPSFHADRLRGLVCADYRYRVGKIGVDSPGGWVATVDGTTGAVFVQRFTFEPKQEYPDGASVEFWHNGAGKIHAYNKDMPMSTNPRENPYVFESEVLSPYAQLQPGESYTWRYAWYVANIGGDFPVVGCNDNGVIAEPLRASRTASGFRLTGRFGVFARAKPRIQWYDAQRQALGGLPLRGDATPLAPLVLDEDCAAPVGARAAALIVGGELAAVELP